MKKLLSIITALVVLFTLCGAGAIAESAPAVDPEGANEMVILEKYNPSHTGDIEHTPSGESDPFALIFNGIGGAGELLQDGDVTETLDASKTLDELNAAVMVINDADAKVIGSAGVVYQNGGGEGMASVVYQDSGTLVLEGTGADDGKLCFSDTVGQPGADSAPALALIILGAGEDEKVVRAISGEMDISGNILDYSEMSAVMAVTDFSSGGVRDISFDEGLAITAVPESGSELDSTLISTLYAGLVDSEGEDDIALSFGGPVSMKVDNTSSGSGWGLGPSGIATLIAVGDGETGDYNMDADFAGDVTLESSGVNAKASIVEFEMTPRDNDTDIDVKIDFGGSLEADAEAQFFSETDYLYINAPGKYTVSLPENETARLSSKGVIADSEGIVLHGRDLTDNLQLDATVNGDLSIASEGTLSSAVKLADVFQGAKLTVNGDMSAGAIAGTDDALLDIEGLYADRGSKIYLNGDLSISAAGDTEAVYLVEAYDDGTEIKVEGDVDFDLYGDIAGDHFGVNTVFVMNGAKVDVGGDINTDLVQAVNARSNDVEVKVGGDVNGGTKSSEDMPENYSLATVEVNVAKDDPAHGEIIIEGTVNAGNGAPALALTFEVENGGRPTETQIKGNIPGLYMYGLSGGGSNPIDVNLLNKSQEYEPMTEEEHDALVEACAEAINYIVKTNSEGDKIELDGENIRHRDDIGYYANEEKTFRAILGDTFDNEYELTGGDGNVTITPVEGKPGEYTVTVHRGGGVTLTAKVTAKPRIDAVELKAGTVTYDRAEHAPAIAAVRSGGTALSADDYSVETLEKGAEAGEYKVRVTAKPTGRYAGGAEAVMKIVPAEITKVVLSKTGYDDDGKPHRPAIQAVYAGDIALKPDEYSVSGLDAHTGAGLYKVTVTARPGGNFTGSAKAFWSIFGSKEDEEDKEERAASEKAAAEVRSLLKTSRTLKEAFKGAFVTVDVTADNKVMVTAEPKLEIDEETGGHVSRMTLSAAALAELASGGADVFAVRDASGGGEAAVDLDKLTDLDISGGVTFTLRSAEDMDEETEAAVRSALEKLGYEPLPGGVFISVTGADAKGKENDLTGSGAVRVRIVPGEKGGAEKVNAVLLVDADNTVTQQEFEIVGSADSPCLEAVCGGSGWYMAGEHLY